MKTRILLKEEKAADIYVNIDNYILMNPFIFWALGLQQEFVYLAEYL